MSKCHIVKFGQNKSYLASFCSSERAEHESAYKNVFLLIGEGVLTTDSAISHRLALGRKINESFLKLIILDVMSFRNLQKLFPEGALQNVPSGEKSVSPPQGMARHFYF